MVKANLVETTIKMVNTSEVVVEAMIKMETRLWKAVTETTMKMEIMLGVVAGAMTLTETKYKTMVAVAITVKATMALLKMESRLLISSTTLWMVKMTILLLMRRKLLVSKNF